MKKNQKDVNMWIWNTRILTEYAQKAPWNTAQTLDRLKLNTLGNLSIVSEESTKYIPN